ncbi:MAG: MFS transporter [Porticoccaceae bacterium]
MSLFMDISSEMIHSLLPIFMATVLGASMVTIGIIEGLAEALVAVVKVFSGVVSDYFGRRKWLLVLGYGLAALTKPVFPLADSIGWVFGARLVDRVGKGIRGAPRDGLIADIVAPPLRGAAYGLRQALDTVGAFAGPVLAVALMMLFASDIKAVFWVATIPAFIAVVVLVVAVREPEVIGERGSEPARLRIGSILRLPLRYWLVLALGAVFSLARFSEAFLLLRAQSLGLAVGLVPLVLVAMNLVYAAVSYPAGRAADRYGSRYFLLAGLAALIIADGLLAFASTPWTVFAGAMLWGLHLGLTQGLFAKLVADAAPAAQRGTAFGVFNLASAGALLLASVVAGALWDQLGAAATFIAGGGFATLAAVGVLVYSRRRA